MQIESQKKTTEFIEVEAADSEEADDSEQLARIINTYKQTIVYDYDDRTYEHLEDLAESFTSSMHMEVPELFACNQHSLQALDNYFTDHQPLNEYSVKYIQQTFIPMLGGFLGEVIIKELGAVWNKRDPIMTSDIRLQQGVVDVFAGAYCVVMLDEKLINIFDSAQTLAV